MVSFIAAFARRSTFVLLLVNDHVMKTKLVLWGLNEKDERILLALDLQAEESKVKVHTFKEPEATEGFSKQLMDEWRNDKEVPFPEKYETTERPLSVSDPLLPENYKVEREDVVQRAQTEWQFIALSAKLNRAYASELATLQDKVEQLDAFDSSIWEELKAFWNKVQTQVRDRNLFRDHADDLRDRTNALFARMKELRSKLDAEFKKKSAENLQQFMEKLNEIDERIKKGLRLQPLFEELKQLQRTFRNTKFTRDDRSKVWKRLDGAFKKVKEKRFGPEANTDKSPYDRLRRRYDGLLGAIGKMEKSIKRDEDELSFQKRKIERTDGQLEAQIREAKIKMIQDRIDSKKGKHADMLKTKKELEARLEKEKKREERRKAEAEAKKKAKADIAKKMQKQSELSKEEAEKLEKAAKELKEAKAKKKPAAKKGYKQEPAASASSNILEDVVDTIGAVAVVVDERFPGTASTEEE